MHINVCNIYKKNFLVKASISLPMFMILINLIQNDEKASFQTAKLLLHLVS